MAKDKHAIRLKDEILEKITELFSYTRVPQSVTKELLEEIIAECEFKINAIRADTTFKS